MNIQTLLGNFLKFLNESIIPFLLAIAFLVFLWNIMRYFVLGGSNEESQEKARSQALWGILAFVVIVSFWGIVNFFIYGLGFDRTKTILPDYMCEKGAAGCTKNFGPDPVTNDLYEAGALPQEI